MRYRSLPRSSRRAGVGEKTDGEKHTGELTDTGDRAIGVEAADANA